MAEIKGKFIAMATGFLSSRPQVQAAAVASVRNLTGKDPKDLEPEGWYETRVLNAIFQTIRQHEDKVGAWVAIKVIGYEVFPTIKHTVGFPSHLQTPLDFMKFEADTFAANHRGPDVIPRRFTKTDPGHVIVEAPSPGYDCLFIEGVFEGILRMCRVYDGSAKQTKCVTKGDSTCEYEIKW